MKPTQYSNVARGAVSTASLPTTEPCVNTAKDMDAVLQEIQSVADTIRGQILSLEDRLQPILMNKGQVATQKVDAHMPARTDLERELNEILDMVVQRKQMLEDLYSRICL